MTKQLVAPKAQADLMESLMGAICLAQLESGAPEARLARGLDAALAFFDAFVCPQAPPREAKAAEALMQTMRLERAGAPSRDERAQRADTMAAAFHKAFGVQITRCGDLLRECVVWSDGEDGLARVRELYGVAADAAEGVDQHVAPAALRHVLREHLGRDAVPTLRVERHAIVKATKEHVALHPIFLERRRWLRSR